MDYTEKRGTSLNMFGVEIISGCKEHTPTVGADGDSRLVHALPGAYVEICYLPQWTARQLEQKELPAAVRVGPERIKGGGKAIRCRPKANGPGARLGGYLGKPSRQH